MELYAEIALIDSIVKNKGSISIDQFRGLKDLLGDLQNEARTKANKAAGVADVEKAFKVIIKSAEKTYNRDLHGAFKRGDYTYACDGHRAIRTKKTVNLLEVRGVAADELWTKAENEIRRHEEVELPNIADFTVDVKTMQKQAGRNATILYTFENGLTVNAVYLLEAMKATGAEVLIRDEGATKKPFFLYGEDVDMLLLPVNSNEHTKPGLRVV